ncbi:hypothetical protein KBW71_02125 [Hydrogenophaga aromaticivorans]|uniref:hypothetical protein n=1 Tax=Hydrogenophaga aromaticivorans TaxID=2610898 RepID=UPI001B39BDC1|nr:hypothetical protein [Hydrogenophaga aromaticivorans]MBQ0917228.1 hypothetical protein [Hydrogenophaga aromaticivorans]
MTYAAYTPKPGSLAEEVISFLMANPDEELTSRDIAVKFDRQINAITPALRTAVHWQHLTCQPGNPNRPAVFLLGPARRRMLENAAQDAPEQPTDSASNALCSYRGQGLDVTRTPGCLRVSNGSQVLDLSAAQVSTLALIGPVLMGQGARA